MAEKIDVFYLSMKDDTPKSGYWDYGLLDELLEGFNSKEVSKLTEQESAIVVLPARSHKDLYKEVRAELQKIDKVILFCMGDEENDFPVEEMEHPNITIWVQNPRPIRHDDYKKIGCGYPPQLRVYKCHEAKEKGLDWMFAGQVTHHRRRDAVRVLETMGGGFLLKSEGFTQGLGHEEYYEKMQQARVVPCPSGPITPDTFRLYEALELGCIPIADTLTPTHDWKGFWEWLFNRAVPFPQIKNMDNVGEYIRRASEQYPYLNNRVQEFWIQYKHDIYMEILKGAESIGIKTKSPDTTIIIPVSPIPSHPDTKILDETLDQIHKAIENPLIYLLIDGVREEQESMRADYEEYIRRLLWNINYKTTKPFIFNEHKHQVGTLRAVIDQITTPFVMYVEQDTPIVDDIKIDWKNIKDFITSGQSNLVRLYHEAHIPKEHKHLMLEKVGDFQETVQWSQRPHIASTAFYKRILNQHFSPNANCFLEDVLHGKAIEDHLLHGRIGYNEWKLHIYHPKGQIKLSYNLDGREGIEKFDEKQIW